MKYNQGEENVSYVPVVVAFVCFPAWVELNCSELFQALMKFSGGEVVPEQGV